MGTASTRSRRRRFLPARTRGRSRSTRALTRTTAQAASPAATTSPSPSRRTTRRSPSPTTRRSHVLTVVADNPTGAPGALSHFGLARKDCLGTARNTTSKVWYTVANGVLSDVYYPTIDNTNVETLQYVVTDGSTFTDLQTRDMTYTVEAKPDSAGMACTVTATAKSGKYRIETEYVTDPARNTVLMAVKFLPTSPGYRLYVRFDATVNGNGGGGPGNGGADSATIDESTGHPVLVSSDPVTATNAANRDYAQPVHAALDGSALRSDERLRRRRGRRARPAGRRPRDHEPDRRGGRRQRRPDGPRGARGRQGRPRARLRRLPGGGRRNGGGLARGRLRQGARGVREGLEGLRQAADEAADGEAAGHQGRGQEAARGRVLPQRQRDQGVRGQDVPRRHRGQPRLPVGPGRLSRRSGEHVLRLLP